MVSRESLPLIFAILVPVALVSLIVLYLYDYDITLSLRTFLRNVPLIYYIIITPIILGFIAAVMYLRKKD